MKKKFLFIILAFSLVLTIIPATIILAQDEQPLEQKTARFNIRSVLEHALNQGIINQNMVDRIKNAWRNASLNEYPSLCKRIINMIRHQYKRFIRLKDSLFIALDEAVANCVITEEKAGYIKKLWLKKPLDERRQLYRRVMNFLNL